MRRLEEKIHSQTLLQLSPTNNRGQNIENNNGHGLDHKLKPDSYDGSVPLREFLTQFNLIARANGWNDSLKTVALAANLKGKARSVLDRIIEIENLDFEELKSKLELRFGGHLAQTYYTQFTNRKQKNSEDLATLGADIERLSQLASPKCTHEVRDKIACAQFIAALSSGFIRRTLQLENATSLKFAVKGAMTIKVINKNSFPRREKNEEKRNLKFNKEKNLANIREDTKEKDKVENKEKERRKHPFERTDNSRFKQQKKECWKCGALGHFRSKCPSETSEEKRNVI